jgi:two-component system response regulator YesN
MTAGRPKVLIVDDDEFLRTALQQCVESLGCETYTAGDGVEALEILLKIPMTMVLTDVQMPKMNGMGLLDAVNERGLNVPVVVMSGYSDYSEADVDARNGVVLLKKPFSAEQLKEIIAIYAPHLPDEA